MSVLAAHICALHGYSVYRGWKRVSGCLQLELQLVVNDHVGATTQTWLPWKSSQCV